MMETRSAKILRILQDGPATARDVCGELGWPDDRTHLKRSSGLLRHLEVKGKVKKVGTVIVMSIADIPNNASLYGLVLCPPRNLVTTAVAPIAATSATATACRSLAANRRQVSAHRSAPGAS